MIVFDAMSVDVTIIYFNTMPNMITKLFDSIIMDNLAKIID